MTFSQVLSPDGFSDSVIGGFVQIINYIFKNTLKLLKSLGSAILFFLEEVSDAHHQGCICLIKNSKNML